VKGTVTDFANQKSASDGGAYLTLAESGTISTFPFTETFEHAGAIPAGWTFTGSITIKSTGTGNHTPGGTYSAGATAGASGSTHLIISDLVDYTGKTGAHLSFWYRCTATAVGSTVKVDASIDGGVSYTVSVVPVFTVLYDSAFHLVSDTGDLSSLAGKSSVKFQWTYVRTAGYINIDDITFSASSAGTVPTVTTSAATPVGTTTATLNGTVTSDGGATITERGFYCDTSSNPTTKYTVSGTTGAYTKDMTGLSSGTKYYFKAFATNSVGTSYGSILDFTTQVAPYCGVEVTIENTLLEGYPSQMLAYTIDVHNSGNVVDNIVLNYIPDGWPDISIVPQVLTDVAPCEHRQATMFIHVPDQALPSTYKEITVVAESQFCGATDNDTTLAHVIETPGLVYNVNKGTWYTTIQAAVDDADSGNTIFVYPGTFDEQVVINKSLTLKGSGENTIVRPSSAAKLTQVFDGLFWYGTPNTKNIAGIIVANVPDGSSVIVENLKVDESSVTTKPAGADYLAGIFYRETGGIVDTVSVVGGGAWSGADRAYGMYLSAATNTVSVEVKNSTISNYDKNGIETMGSNLTANIHNNTITGRGSITDEAQNGVSVGQGATATVNNNTISNLVYGPETWWDAGILLVGGGSGSTANGNTIDNCQIGIGFNDTSGSATGNTVSGGAVGKDGLLFQHSGLITPGSWTTSFVGNTVSGFSVAGLETWSMYSGTTLAVTIQGNQFTGGSGDGILIDGSDGSIVATISNNTISNWQNGINLDSAVGSGTTITGNTITNNISAGSGIHIGAAVNAANVSAHFNNIVGNQTYGIYNGSSGTLNATCNWWGNASGPGGSGPGTGDNISTNVLYSPWLGFTIGTVPMTFHVDNTGTIQSAVDAASSGDTIIVHSGTYGPFTVNGKSNLAIKAASVPIVEGVQSVSTNYGNRDTVVFVKNSTNIVLEGLDIEGDGLGTINSKNYCIIYENSSGTIENCKVSPNTVGDMYSTGIGIWDGSNVTIDSCVIENFGRIGVFIYNGCTVGIYNSTIIGQVYNDINLVNYGIEVEGAYDNDDPATASNVTIRGNEIYNCSNLASSPLWTSDAIGINGWLESYPEADSTVVIEGNNLHNNYIGIEVCKSPSSYAHFNSIHNNLTYGIINKNAHDDTSATFNATCNWWGDESGPYNPTTNPSGLGDNVSDNVTYAGWARAPIGTVWTGISPPSQSGANGVTLNYTVTVQNTDNVSHTFNLTDNAGSSWLPSIVENSLTVLPNEDNTATFSVTVPSGLLAGTIYNMTVTATSQDNGSVSASASCTAEVAIARSVSVSISLDAQEGLLGQTLTYTVTVTNNGNATDNFDLSVVADTLGWGASVSPTPLTIAPGASDNTATLSVTVPWTARGCQTNSMTVQAVSRGDNTKKDNYTVTAHVQVVCGVEVTIENKLLEGWPSQVLAYTIDVHNSGTVVDNIILSWIPDGWPDINIVPPVLIDVAPCETRQATMFIHVPDNASPCIYKQITVIAESQFCGATDSDNAMAHVIEQPVCGVEVTIENKLLEGYPSQMLAYTIDVHNSGNVVDNINLSYIPDGWPDISIVPQVLTDVAPCEHRQATMFIHVPDNASPCTYKQIIVVAESQFCGAQDSDNAMAHVTGLEGSGTSEDPYIIKTIGQLQLMKDNLTAYYALGNDIDASATTTWNDNGTGGYYGFFPIGTSATKFTGSFDGRGCKISNLYINRPSTNLVGLFGLVGSGGVVKNVGLENENVTDGTYVGGLVGVNYGTVSNSYSTGTVSGGKNHCVGGLVGYNEGTVSNSYSTGPVSGSGNSDAGGLVGNNYGGTVSNSYSTGPVSGSGNSNAGGLVGLNYGPVSNSYSTGTVSGSGGVGGLVGYNYYDGAGHGTVSNCYSTGTVSGGTYVGGLVGLNQGTVSNSFWDKETSGKTTSAGGTGKTTENMKYVRTFTDNTWSTGLTSPWDFVGNPYKDVKNVNIWNIDGVNSGYPFLAWQYAYDLTFTQTGLDSTAIGTVENLNGLLLTRDNLPYSIWVDNGTVENFTYSSIVSSTTGGKQFRLVSVSDSSPLTVTASKTVTANYVLQYKLTMATNFGTTSPTAGDYWYDNGTVVSISATAPDAGPGEQYVWSGWTGTGTGSYTGPSNSAQVTMSSAITETASWIYQFCGVEVTIENKFLEGPPSTYLNYTIDVHNSGNVVDNFNLSVIPDGWPDITIIPPVLIDVLPCETRQATMLVHVPDGAVPCTYKQITVVAESQFCGATDSDNAQAHVTEKLENFTLHLVAGWNLVGFQVTNENMTPDNLFAGTTFTMYQWAAPYGPYSEPSYTSPVTDNRGYWVMENQDTTITFSGVRQSSRTMYFATGWNLVHFPLTSANTTPDNLFAGTTFTMYQWAAPYGPYSEPSYTSPVTDNRGYWVMENQNWSVQIPI